MTDHDTPSMDLAGYIARVNVHLDRLGVPADARPDEAFYLDAWNNQTIAHKLATMIARRRRKRIS